MAIFITFTRTVFKLGALCRMHSLDLELTIERGMAQPMPCIDSVDEKIIELEHFPLHIYTPKSYSGGHGAIVTIHGGGWFSGQIIY